MPLCKEKCTLASEQTQLHPCGSETWCISAACHLHQAPVCRAHTSNAHFHNGRPAVGQCDSSLCSVVRVPSEPQSSSCGILLVPILQRHKIKFPECFYLSHSVSLEGQHPFSFLHDKVDTTLSNNSSSLLKKCHSQILQYETFDILKVVSGSPTMLGHLLRKSSSDN